MRTLGQSATFSNTGNEESNDSKNNNDINKQNFMLKRDSLCMIEEDLEQDPIMLETLELKTKLRSQIELEDSTRNGIIPMNSLELVKRSSNVTIESDISFLHF